MFTLFVRSQTEDEIMHSGRSAIQWMITLASDFFNDYSFCNTIPLIRGMSILIFHLLPGISLTK